MPTVPISTLAATWNNGATTFTGIGMDVTDTASASASLLLDLKLGGASRFQVRKDGNTVGPNLGNVGISGYASYLTTAVADAGFYGSSNSAGLFLGASYDAVLRRDAADTLALRRSTNAQTLRVYNTYTDSSNYERIQLGWGGNRFNLVSDAGGTGTATRTLGIGTAGAGTISFFTSNADRWQINGANGHFLAFSDAVNDIGASGANRPRNLYMGSWLRMAVTTVGSLPAAATAGAGALMFVSDALTPVFGSAVAAGGAVTVPVYSTGSAWNVG
jgi:hypothetical protein